MEGLSDYERGDWVPRGPDDGAGRRRLRHRPGDERARRVRSGWKPKAHVQPRARGLRIHRGAVRQRGHSPVSVRAQEKRHRRWRGRVRRSVQDAAGRIRSGLRALPQGAVQAVPGSGAAGRLRPQSGAEPGEDAVYRSAGDCPVAFRRSDCRRHGQPQGSRVRHRPPVDEGPVGRAEPDGRVRQGHGVHEPGRDERRSDGHALDVVVAQRGSPGVLRAHREGARADRAERPDAERSRCGCR